MMYHFRPELIRYISYGWSNALICGIIMYKYGIRVMRHVLLFLRVKAAAKKQASKIFNQ